MNKKERNPSIPNILDAIIAIVLVILVFFFFNFIRNFHKNELARKFQNAGQNLAVNTVTYSPDGNPGLLYKAPPEDRAIKTVVQNISSDNKIIFLVMVKALQKRYG